MPFIRMITSTGTSVVTSDCIGTKAEEKYWRVMMCNGGLLDSEKKYYFEDEKAYNEWSGNSRKKCEELGTFPLKNSNVVVGFEEVVVN